MVLATVRVEMLGYRMTMKYRLGLFLCLAWQAWEERAQRVAHISTPAEVAKRQVYEGWIRSGR